MNPLTNTRTSLGRNSVEKENIMQNFPYELFSYFPSKTQYYVNIPR